MRIWAMVVMAFLGTGCRSLTRYAVIVPEDADADCISRCRSVNAIRGASEGTLCMADCGSEVRKNEECRDQPEGTRCVDSAVSHFSFWKTALLVGGIIVGGVVVTTLAATASRR